MAKTIWIIIIPSILAFLVFSESQAQLSLTEKSKDTLQVVIEVENGIEYVTINADDISVPELLLALARKSHQGIVFGEDLKRAGRITIHVKNVTFDDALYLITKATGFSFEKIGTTVSVKKINNPDSESTE